MSSYCINENILVDCGEGTTKSYKSCGVDIKKIKHILITHIHSDHFLGLASYISNILVYGKQEDRKKLSIYGPKGTIEAIKILQKTFACPDVKKEAEDYINIVEITNFNKPFKVENFEVTPIKLKHGNILNIAYQFKEEESKIIGFSGDCTYDEDTDKFVSGCSVALIDCCNEKTTVNHMGADNMLLLKQKYPLKRLIAVHCTDEFITRAKSLEIETTQSGAVYNF